MGVGQEWVGGFEGKGSILGAEGAGTFFPVVQVQPCSALAPQRFLACRACRVFTSEGGGVNRAPQNWGGGVREKGSIDRHH